MGLRVAPLIRDRFTSGHYPYWRFTCSGIEHQNISDGSIDRIAQLVADGYVEGEILEGDGRVLSRVWWKIEIED